MAGTTFKIEGPDVAPGGPGGTVVNITFHQESGLAYLCKGAASLVRGREAAKDAPGAPSARRPRGGEQKALGGAQILLGAICIGLGVVLSMPDPNGYMDYYYKRAIFNGVPFWMGSLFILSGTFSVVGARHGGKWVHLATVLNLGSVVSGSVAFALGLTEFPALTYQPYFVKSLCKRNTEDWRYGRWGVTEIPSPSYDGEPERARQCQAALWSLVRMWSCTQILLIILHSAALAIALFGFGYGLRRLWVSCSGTCHDYTAVMGPEESKEPGKEQSAA